MSLFYLVLFMAMVLYLDLPPLSIIIFLALNTAFVGFLLPPALVLPNFHYALSLPRNVRNDLALTSG